MTNPLATQKYVHRPLFVEAIQVTAENMVAVAEWCSGSVQIPGERSKDIPGPFIKVRALRPAHEKQTMAFEGDWVVKSDRGFRVFNNTAFEANFDMIDDNPVQM